MLDPFKTDKDAQRVYRELKLLISLNHPDAQVCRTLFSCILQTSFVSLMSKVVQLFNVFTPETNLNNFQTLYVKIFPATCRILYFIVLFNRYFVFNFAGQNLDEAIRNRKSFTEGHIRVIIYSILRGLKVHISYISFHIYLTKPFSDILLFCSLCILLVLFIV